MRIKKGMRAFCLLMVMALVGAVFVPAVSASENLNSIEEKDLIEGNLISINSALKQATIYMWDYISEDLDEGKWIDATIKKEPLKIYDLNGELLFYQFSIEKRNKAIGEINVPASKVLGVSIQTIGEPDPYDIESSLKNAQDIIDNNYPNSEFISSKVVCYDYPKLGIMVDFLNLQDNKKNKLIFDAFELSKLKADEKPKLYTGWSYYKQFSNEQFSENIYIWNVKNQKIDELIKKLNLEGFDCDSISNKSNIQHYTEILSNSKAKGESNYITSFPTVLQQHTNWCMIATAWLITKYNYPSTTRTQTNIANHMGVYSNNSAPGQDEYTEYYTDPYSQGGLGKTNSVSYTNPNLRVLQYSEIKKEINANRPISVGAGPHERACIGYWQYTNGDKLYKFSDPGDKKTKWEAADSQGLIININSYTFIK